ncbi:MAG: hypothetical protein HKO02_10135 [Hyphomonadaceae bacterium]|nr:hypothetical protein [Hyphomonadaceae bacterium]
MSGPLLPATIMFTVTVLATAAFWFPAIKFSQRCKVVSFYWVGFWAFMCWIAALSGAQAILIILGLDVQRFAGAVLTGISASFVIFVMFAWARLTLRGVNSLVSKAK